MAKVIYSFFMENHRFLVKYAVPPLYCVQELPRSYKGPHEATDAFKEAVPDEAMFLVPTLFNQLFVEAHEEAEQALVFQPLTGQLLYESNPSPHKLDWDELRIETQALFLSVAANLRTKLSLCGKCGRQAPLDDEYGTCPNCEAEIRHEEGARQAEYELRIQQTTASEFSSEEAFEEWEEENR